MKEKIIEKINYVPPFGYIQKGLKNFNDKKYVQKENIYQYRLSKIKIFKGENNSIIGIHSFFKNNKNEEISGEEGYNKEVNILETITLDIAPNDYLTNMNVWLDDDYHIKKLKFGTKKGKEVIVGEGGEAKEVTYLNKDKENIILYLYGGYKEQLHNISCKYINNNHYFGNIYGYFELRIKLKNENFKKLINSNLKDLKYEDKILLSACLLPNSCFNIVMAFCVIVK